MSMFKSVQLVAFKLLVLFEALSKFMTYYQILKKNCAILFNGYDILNAKYFLVAIIIAFAIIE